MNESKNYLKLVEKERRSIENLLKENLIGYKDSMFKIDNMLKAVTTEIDILKDCHGKDFKNLANELNNAKEPLRKVLEKATIENESILKELERTQRNNRTLIDDYLKNISDNGQAKSQVNLFWSMSNDDLSNTYFNQRSQRSIYFPKVSTALTSSIGDETSIWDIFRNTVSSFQGYKKDAKSKIHREKSESDLVPISRQVKSVTRGGRYKEIKGIDEETNEYAKINEGKLSSLLIWFS